MGIKREKNSSSLPVFYLYLIWLDNNATWYFKGDREVAKRTARWLITERRRLSRRNGLDLLGTIQAELTAKDTHKVKSSEGTIACQERKSLRMTNSRLIPDHTYTSSEMYLMNARL